MVVIQIEEGERARKKNAHWNILHPMNNNKSNKQIVKHFLWLQNIHVPVDMSLLNHCAPARTQFYYSGSFCSHVFWNSIQPKYSIYCVIISFATETESKRKESDRYQTLNSHIMQHENWSYCNGAFFLLRRSFAIRYTCAPQPSAIPKHSRLPMKHFNSNITVISGNYFITENSTFYFMFMIVAVRGVYWFAPFHTRLSSVQNRHRN